MHTLLSVSRHFSELREGKIFLNIISIGELPRSVTVFESIITVLIVSQELRSQNIFAYSAVDHGLRPSKFLPLEESIRNALQFVTHPIKNVVFDENQSPETIDRRLAILKVRYQEKCCSTDSIPWKTPLPVDFSLAEILMGHPSSLVAEKITSSDGERFSHLTLSSFLEQDDVYQAVLRRRDYLTQTIEECVRVDGQFVAQAVALAKVSQNPESRNTISVTDGYSICSMIGTFTP